MVRQIEKFQRDFLWNDSIEQWKYHLVIWEVVCKPIAEGGLGIRAIDKMNNTLLGKWLWRMCDSSQGLWKQILIGKCKIGRDAWSVLIQNSKASGFWKSIISIKNDLDQWIRYRVHDGHRISFCHDQWCGQPNLRF